MAADSPPHGRRARFGRYRDPRCATGNRRRVKQVASQLASSRRHQFAGHKFPELQHLHRRRRPVVAKRVPQPSTVGHEYRHAVKETQIYFERSRPAAAVRIAQAEGAMAWLRRSSASAYPNDSASAVNSRSSSGRRRRASAESVLPTSSKPTSTDSRGKFRKPRLSAVPPRRQIPSPAEVAATRSLRPSASRGWTSAKAGMTGSK